MNIKDGFKIDDEVSGLKIEIIKGKNLDRIHIEHIGKPIASNRDFWFDRDGEFDGTGSDMRQE